MRATVRRARLLDTLHPGWATHVWDERGGTLTPHDTHAEALAYAIHEVGLSTPPEHREAP